MIALALTHNFKLFEWVIAASFGVYLLISRVRGNKAQTPGPVG
jgi:hypothetical protein